jgi:peroxiredoxin
MFLMRLPLAPAAALALLATSLFAATIPRPAPELTFRLTSGQPAKLSQWRGKVILLEFLLTTCSHCQRTSQTMNKLQAEYASRGVQSVGVAINDENGSLTAAYVKELGLKYPVGWTKHPVAVDFLQHPVMVSMMMPQLVVIDRKGVIRAQYPGTDPFFEKEEAGIRKWINSLLKESGGSRTSAGGKTALKQAK